MWQSHALEKFRVLDLGRLVDAHEKNQRVGLAAIVQDLPVFGLIKGKLEDVNDFGCEVKESQVESSQPSQVKSSRDLTCGCELAVNAS